MGFPQPRATHEDHASLLPTAISERRADFNTPENQPTHSKRKHMKKLITLTGIASIGVVLMLASCSSQPGTTTATTRQTTTTTNAAENRMSQPIGYRDIGAGAHGLGGPSGPTGY